VAKIHTLYRFFDKNGSLAYVGRTGHPDRRPVIFPRWRLALGYGPKTVSVSLRNALAAWNEYKTKAGA